MTMPKKGTRKIVVNNTVYKYIIKPYSAWGGIRGGSITIEKPDGMYISKDVEHSITPSIVENIIKSDIK